VLLELHLEVAVDGRRHVEVHAAARLHVLADVVSVEVDLVGGVALDRDVDPAALLVGELLDAADRLGVLDLDGRRAGGRRVARAGRADDDHGCDGYDDGDAEQREALSAGHAAEG